MHAYVVGNAALDETYAVSALPKGGESIFGTVVASNVGGKGSNQAIVLSRCGVPTTLIAAVGTDARANIVRASMEDEGLASGLISLPSRATDVSVILRLTDGENAIVTTTDSADNLRFDEVRPLIANADPGDVVVMQGNLSAETTLGVMQYAKQRGMIVAFNPSPLQDYFSALWPYVDIVFVNAGEAIALTGKSDEEASYALLSLGINTVIQTNGEGGALLVTSAEREWIPAVECEVIDTTGAGDTFMAVALASSMLRGVKIDACAVESASWAASRTVSRLGTFSAFPTRLELAGLLTRP